MPIQDINSYKSEFFIGLATCDLCGSVNQNIDSWVMQPYIKDKGWWQYEPRIQILYTCQSCRRLRKKVTGANVMEKIKE